MKILFICDLKYQAIWKDGLWAALELLKQRHEIEIWNLNYKSDSRVLGDRDFVLGWGAFGSSVDIFLREQIKPHSQAPIGLCIGGTAQPPVYASEYNVLFYETEWYRKNIIKDFIQTGGHAVHAFGVNTDIYFPKDTPKTIDWLTVGSFSLWKRQHALIQKEGARLAIGEIQKENLTESMGIITRLLAGGVGIMDMVDPAKLAEFYRMSNNVLIPCELHGGGERAVLEARACGTNVEVIDDNPKLVELSTSTIYDHYYYAKQIEEGITNENRSK